jgi:hypothetical protein
MARKESIMETTQLVNLTPHTINLVAEDGTQLLSLESQGVARVAATTEVVGQLQVGEVVVPQTHTTFGEVEGLPEQTSGVGYIVSNMIISALAQQGVRRDDLFTPGMQVRDDQGRVIGCRSLDN